MNVFLFFFSVSLIASSLTNSFWRDGRLHHIGKEAINAKDVPYFAGVWCRYHTSWELKPWCGGVFIHKNWMITAAHCLDVGPGINENIVIKKSDESRLKVIRVVTPENYGFNTDIALVQVEDPGASSFIKLPAPKFDEKYFDNGINVTIYNLLDKNKDIDGGASNSTELRRKKSQLMLENESCYSGEFYPFDFDRQFCASLNLTYGLKYCPGDSGSPAVANEQGNETLVGIICHITYECDVTDILRADNIVFMNVFIRISTFMPWILEQLHKYKAKDIEEYEKAWRGYKYPPA